MLDSSVVFQAKESSEESEESSSEEESSKSKEDHVKSDKEVQNILSTSVKY